jgi:hypothetical protein
LDLLHYYYPFFIYSFFVLLSIDLMRLIFIQPGILI